MLGKIIKMDYIKEEWLVLEIAGPDLATIKAETILDENVVRGVMRMVKGLFAIGGALMLVAFLLDRAGITIPGGGESGEPSSAAGAPVVLAVVALFVGGFYLVFYLVKKNLHTHIIADKAKGTIEVQERFKNRERKPRVTVGLADVTRLENKSEEVYNSDGPNYNETGIYALDKNNRSTKLTWFGGVLKLERILAYFNRWLHGKESSPVVYREQI
ncbi:MAG: hypothetical protein Q6373_017220 [Candidatus Sigynarchaeota archaeon]